MTEKQKIITKRTIMCAEYVLKNKSTIRDVSKYFSISKSSIHRDLSERLREIDKNLYNSVTKILQDNFNKRIYNMKKARMKVNKNK